MERLTTSFSARYRSATDQIIEREWQMFVAVPSRGGPAGCQEDRATFEIMRRAQVVTWTPEVIASYLDDLRVAEEAGRNLMTEKYARMMAGTHQEEFRELARFLPEVEEQAQRLISELVALHDEWDAEVAMRYPALRSRGRPMDQSGGASARTYMEGELATYSIRTLELLAAHSRMSHHQGKNLVAVQLEATVEAYGYPSLGAAEARLAHEPPSGSCTCEEPAS